MGEVPRQGYFKPPEMTSGAGPGPCSRGCSGETAINDDYHRPDVEAVLDGDSVKSDPVRVKTPPAPLGMARLEGTFTVDLRDTSHYGFSSFPGDIQSGWRFKPNCRRGACDVTWKDAQGVALAGVLENTGPRYEGTATTRLASCGDLRGSGTVTVEIEIVKAATVRDAWRATKIVGTFLERFPAQLGCVASGADYQVTGHADRLTLITDRRPELVAHP